MKRKILLTILTTTLFIGCSTTSNPDLSKINEKRLKDLNSYKTATKPKSRLSKKEESLARIIDVSFFKENINEAMSKVASSLNIPIDKSFIPASRYKITVNYNGTLEAFFNYVYTETGVKYKIRNGTIIIYNKSLVEQSLSTKKCPSGSNNTITISLKNTSIEDTFKYFSDNFGFSFSFDYRFNKKEGIEPEESVANQNFFYKGCDVKEALAMFLRNNDLASKQSQEKKYTITDYQIKNISLPTFFNYNFTSGTGLGTTESGTKVSTEENFKQSFLSKLQVVMTENGRVDLSNRGYLTILDKPSRVREVVKIINKEFQSQTPLDLKIDVIRVDLSNSIEKSASFNLLAQNVFKSNRSFGTQFKPTTAVAETGEAVLTTTTAQMLAPLAQSANGFVISGFVNNLPQIISLLQTYGDAEVVREYNAKTRAGILNNFKAVDQIPYVTTTTTTDGGVAQTSAEAKFAEAGIIINVIPSLEQNGEEIDLTTNIVVSEYLGDKTFNINGGEYKLPQISTNETSIPAKLKIGQSIVLTGFKLTNRTIDRNGLPNVSQNSTLGWLFGEHAKKDKLSNFIIVITVDKLRDI